MRERGKQKLQPKHRHSFGRTEGSISERVMIGLAMLTCAATVTGAQDYPATIDLGALDGTNGVLIQGTEFQGQVGDSVAGIGDINDDGFDDLLIGTGFNGESNAYVLYGGPTIMSPIDLGALDGSDGVALLGGMFNNTGISVATAGDFNNDDIPDLIIGGDDSDPFANDFGGGYVLLGGSNFANGEASILLDVYVDGVTGVTVEGVAPNAAAGDSVSGGSDINNDGFDDVIVGAFGAGPLRSGSGLAHILYGASAFPPYFNFRNLGPGIGFSVAGAEASENTGDSVAMVGDVNNDGFGDFMVNGGSDPDGDATLVYGAASFPTFVDLAAINGSNGVVFQGPAVNRPIGSFTTVAPAGDVNGDGLEDMLIGAMWAGDSLTGGAYIVFGAQDLPPRVLFTALAAGEGVELRGENTGDQLGSHLAAAGDINQDGFDDVIVGSRFADSQGDLSGTSYVVFGGDSLPASISLATLDGSNGFALLGPAAGSTAGIVNGAGDVNGDGVLDLIVGGPSVDVGGISDAGEAYIVYGLSGLSIAQEGACPGDIEVNLSGFTANSQASGFKGTAGDSVVPDGPCAGAELQILDVGERLLIDIDATGKGTAIISAPIGSCDDFVQVMDNTTCETSEAAPVGD